MKDLFRKYQKPLLKLANNRYAPYYYKARQEQQRQEVKDLFIKYKKLFIKEII